MMAGLGDGAGVGSGGTAGVGSGGAAGGGEGGSGTGGASGSGNGTSGTAGSSGAGSGTAGAQGNGAGGAAAGGLGTEGGAAKSWRDSLPDELKTDATLSKYSDVGNLAKAHVELQKKFGQKGVFKPGKDASPEEIRTFRESMGIPTDVAKYDMGAFEGLEVPAETVAWAQKMGVEHGIEPAALKAVITDYMKLEVQNATALKTATQEGMQEGLKSLKTEWGEAYDRNLSRANFAAQKLGGQPLIDRLTKFGAHNDPVLLKAFSEAAKLYGEDKLREAGAGDGRQSPQELDAEIASVQGRLLTMKPSDGAYLGVKQRYESLWKQKTGGR